MPLSGARLFDVTIEGFSLLSAECGNVTYQNVRQVLREPTRAMSVSADTFNIPQNNGHIVIRNCQVERK
jgi:hypothetical protein